MVSGDLSVKQAAARLGMSRSSIVRMCRQGRLQARHQGREWRIDQATLEALGTERFRWISQETAGRLVGLPTSTIKAAAGRGELTLRGAHHALPSLDRGEVLRWAGARRRRQETRAAQQLDRENATRPPEDGRVWLDVETVAIMLSCSPRWVRMLAEQDRLPHLRRRRRLWFVREHIETISAARAFRHLQSGAASDAGRETTAG